MIILTDIDQFIEIRNRKSLDLCQELVEVQKRHLRETFDKAYTNAAAQACIDLAETLKFLELAKEMKQDLNVEEILSATE